MGSPGGAQRVGPTLRRGMRREGERSPFGGQKAFCPRGRTELTQETPTLEAQTHITLSTHGRADAPRSPPAEEEGGAPVPTAGLLQVAERRQPLSSVSSLEVHFDLLDFTELTDVSDQELAEVFADSDEENAAQEPPAGPHPHSTPRAGYLRSPSWTRTKAEAGREKKHLGDSKLRAEAFLAVEKPKEE
ncbi:dysbindin domain-containing protein 1 isoform X1 [Crotalus tigris]|uniref:dysbindin domain-containing protein 1 isoform X1 n=1 Tax=Crotalus tigris TaxID=88082 RepID=UPI00192FABDB|nr:dysbindin domain-containing protein 1 isoform X1 [Crotalus tigris]